MNFRRFVQVGILPVTFCFILAAGIVYANVAVSGSVVGVTEDYQGYNRNYITYTGASGYIYYRLGVHAREWVINAYDGPLWCKLNVRRDVYNTNHTGNMSVYVQGPIDLIVQHDYNQTSTSSYVRFYTSWSRTGVGARADNYNWESGGGIHSPCDSMQISG